MSRPRTYKTKDGRLRLVVQDCMKVLARLEDESVDLVVTSPPYNLNIPYASYRDNRDYADYLAWMREIAVEVRRVLKPAGSYFLNIGATNTNPWLAFDVASQARDVFHLQNHIIWAKSISIGENTYGHFKPITSQRFLNNIYEDIFHFTKDGNVPLDRRAIGVPFVYKSNISRFGHSEDKRCKGNIWHIPYKTIQRRSDKGDHPAIFPEELVRHCVKLHGFDEDTLLLDPFVGTGTSLVVAQELGIRGIGCEIDEGYAQDAWNRVLRAQSILESQGEGA